MIPYDLDGLKERARDRCIAEGIVPTRLALYHMVPTLRKEELLRGRAAADDGRAIDTALTGIDVECVELPR